MSVKKKFVLSCQTVIVCPYCPGLLETAACVLVLDMASTSVSDHIDYCLDGDGDFVFVPVRCRACRSREIEELDTDGVFCDQWANGVPVEYFFGRYSKLVGLLSKLLNKQVIVPEVSSNGGVCVVPVYSVDDLVEVLLDEDMYLFDEELHGLSYRSFRILY